MSLAFHSKNIWRKIAPLNDSTYKSTPIYQLPYTAIDRSESFIAIKFNIYTPVVDVMNKLQPLSTSILGVSISIEAKVKHGEYLEQQRDDEAH